MAWIELHDHFREHPKVFRLAKLLGVDFNEAQSYLINLWLWCVSYASDGNLSTFSDTEIAVACRSTNTKPEKLMQALLEARFIDLKDGKKRLHDWKKYGLRILNQSKKRTRKYRETKDLGGKAVTQQDSDGHALLSISLSNLSIPSNHSLRSEAFATAWGDWVKFRKEMRKPLKLMTVNAQLQFLSSQANPVAVIKQSIQNSWQGLFELKTSPNKQPAPSKVKMGQCDYCHEPIVENERYQHLNFCKKVTAPPKEIKEALDGLAKNMSAK